MKNRIKTIIICSSASFYRQVLEIKNRLQKRGLKVLIPSTALRMRRNNNFKVEDYKYWYKDPRFFPLKTKFIKNHLKKIERSEMILVVNLEKNGQKGYVGGNVLVEMAIAFYLNKRIYILNNIDRKNPFYEEILAMRPMFLGGI